MEDFVVFFPISASDYFLRTNVIELLGTRLLGSVSLKNMMQLQHQTRQNDFL